MSQFKLFDSNKYVLESTATLKKKKTFVAETLTFLNSVDCVLTEYTPTDLTGYRDGLLCLKAEPPQGSPFYICILDPNVRGGTFSNENLVLFHQFLHFLNQSEDQSPFLFLASSGGVRLTQKRIMFNAIWGVVPKLFILNQRRPFLSLAHELCLGASALFFAQAHFRVASTSKTLVNLTGPGVIQSFFGDSDLSFSQYATAAHQFERHLLIQEIGDGLESALRRLFQISQINSKLTLMDCSLPRADQDVMSENSSIHIRSDKYVQFLETISDSRSEIIPHYSGSGACYICQKNGKYFGLLINPLDHPVNAISIATIEKYKQALALFKAFKLPLLAVTDTPGGDPRQKSSDQNVIIKSLELIESYVLYPYFKIGLIAGRCFGGSGLFSLPIAHGSRALFALENSKMGAISDEIIEQLAKANTVSYQEWKQSESSHKKDLSDLVESGNLTAVIKWSELSELMKCFLKGKVYGRE